MSEDGPKFPTVLPTDPLKRTLLVTAGRIARRVAPWEATKVARGELPNDLTLWHRVLLAATVDRAEKKGDLAALEPLHRWLWTGKQAEVFHRTARDRFTKWWLPHHSKIVEPLREVLEKNGIKTLVEVGAGNGLVLADLAKRLPKVEKLIGLDLSEAQMQANARETTDPRFQFVGGDAGAWLPQHAGNGWAVVTNAGVFEYFPQERLQELFGFLATKRPACISLIEPLAEHFDPEVARPSVPYNFERSFSHPYVAMLQKAGFKIQWRQEQHIDGVRWIMMVAQAAA
ncbi:MAG: class I SAM-dependent methyltransferase [Myxococcaceae bacterium]|nr:class I SAM-dependent methyltransferase [Myxococcaceae bacterium]